MILLLDLNGNAQKQGPSRVDSLLNELKQSPGDAIKLRLLLDIMTTYNYFNQQKGLEYESVAIETARTLGSKSEMANVKNVVGRLHWREGNFQDALRNHNEARQIFEGEKNKEKIAVTIRYLGQDYADAGNYPEAQQYFLKALTMYQEMNDRLNMAYMYDLLNWLYGKQGNYVEASKYAYTTLRLFEDMGDQDNAALAASNIAENYIHLGNYTDALKYFKRSHSVYKTKGDILNLGYSYSLIGKANRLMRNYSAALSYYDSAASIGIDVQDDNIVANAYVGKAEVYKELKDDPKILSNFKKAANLFKIVSNKYELARVYSSIGDYYRTKQSYDSAKKYYNHAYEISTTLDSRTLFAEYYRGLEVLDSATQNWRGAYLNYKRYILNRDSIFNQETVRKMVQLQLNYEFDKKEASAKANQELRDLRQRNQFLVGGVITLLVFSLVIVLYRNQKKQVQSNLELQQKSKSLEEENREKTSILDIVSHDLKAPLDKIKGLADIMMLEKNMDTEEKERYLEHIKQSIDQGTYLIKKLKEAQSAHDASNKPAYEIINLSKFIEDFKFGINGQLFNKNQELNVELEPANMELNTDPNMFIRILDNLASNASKFSERGKTIHLRIWLEGNSINVSVRDEGPGISAVDQQKLFGKFQTLSSRPTAGESSTGLGLSITKALTEKLNGSIEVNSELGSGSEFIVRIPITGAKS